jgi:hypothetical protein
MEVQFLTSVMGTITVVATYYWAGRPSLTPVQKQNSPSSAAPIRVCPPYWSNEWI